MRAYIEDLKGKYYGTSIRYFVNDCPCSIEVWNHTDCHTPSQRQLDYWEMTYEEAKDDGMMCDSHYETENDYNIAKIIVEALNKEK